MKQGSSFYGGGFNSFYRNINTYGYVVNNTPKEKELGPAAIVSFNDAVENSKINQLKANIEPVQDLHGYGVPWAAGAGKNILAPRSNGTATSVGVTLTSTGGQYSLNGTASAIFVFDSPINIPAGTYIWNAFNPAPPTNGIVSVYLMAADNSVLVNRPLSSHINDTDEFTISKKVTNMRIRGTSGTVVSNYTLKPVISTTAVSTFEPYSNICPITGRTGANIIVSPTLDAEDGTTYNITFPSEAGTVYGGSLDVTNGVLTVNRVNIASYNGETISGAWISDRNAYSPGTAPTTGAQVVYELDTPLTYQLTPLEIETLLGTNNIWADTGDITIKYLAKK